ncbi:hypothetical protein GGX14DRAFT_634327 [Mycena pura]|uniref:Uncharacterized protein n=1 Tax=Mycena pura TaxID=153505 RepID=A0AAD6VI77_9AGAR|nr:hypothetical protein GGX14DRAFT_634327 [Mycena pura]
MLYGSSISNSKSCAWYSVFASPPGDEANALEPLSCLCHRSAAESRQVEDATALSMDYRLPGRGGRRSRDPLGWFQGLYRATRAALRSTQLQGSFSSRFYANSNISVYFCALCGPTRPTGPDLPPTKPYQRPCGPEPNTNIVTLLVNSSSTPRPHMPLSRCGLPLPLPADFDFTAHRKRPNDIPALPHMDLQDINAENVHRERANKVSLALTNSYAAAAASPAGVTTEDVGAPLLPYYAYSDAYKILLVGSPETVRVTGPLPVYMTILVEQERLPPTRRVQYSGLAQSNDKTKRAHEAEQNESAEWVAVERVQKRALPETESNESDADEAKHEQERTLRGADSVFRTLLVPKPRPTSSAVHKRAASDDGNNALAKQPRRHGRDRRSSSPSAHEGSVTARERPPVCIICVGPHKAQAHPATKVAFSDGTAYFSALNGRDTSASMSVPSAAATMPLSSAMPPVDVCETGTHNSAISVFSVSYNSTLRCQETSPQLSAVRAGTIIAAASSELEGCICQCTLLH